MSSPYFTVFTPTYNRAHTLEKVYRSLLEQTTRDFEWLIVDDGSTDGTRELVAGWRAAAPFSIRYLYQENKGKHWASNVGIREAAGFLFLFLDSDDPCVPDALERLRECWEQIPASQREDYSTLSVLCMDAAGKIIGSEYPAHIVDASSVWEQIRLRSGGERWGVNRTKALRNHQFPEIPGEKFVPEALVWNRLAQRYRARFVNVPLRIYEQTADGLSAKLTTIRTKSPQGTSLYYWELSELDIPALHRWKALINWIRFSLHAGRSPLHILRASPSRVTSAALLPLGALFFRRDRRQA